MYITYFLYEQEGWVQIDENRYQIHGQVWPTQIGINLISSVSAESTVLNKTLT